LVLVSLLLPTAAAAEVICALGPAASSYNAYEDQRPSADAMQLAGQVNAALSPMCSPNCPQIALFRNSTAPNAMLVVSPGGDAKIVYAPQFFTSIYESAGDGAILAVIAHELGHAVSETAPAAWMKAIAIPELRADAWAGCVLAKANLSARALQESLSTLAKYPSPAHPAWNVRVPALRTGYTQCGGDAARFTSAAAPEHK
jgi:hypothetical protein